MIWFTELHGASFERYGIESLICEALCNANPRRHAAITSNMQIGSPHFAFAQKNEGGFSVDIEFASFRELPKIDDAWRVTNMPLFE